VPSFGATIPLALHRPMLRLAHDYFDRGDYIAAGCCLRESIDRYLQGLVDLYQVKPGKKKRNKYNMATPAGKLKALRASGVDVCCWLGDIVHTCNKLAHCERVDRDEIGDLLELTYLLLDDFRLTRGEGVPQ